MSFGGGMMGLEGNLSMLGLGGGLEGGEGGPGYPGMAGGLGDVSGIPGLGSGRWPYDQTTQQQLAGMSPDFTGNILTSNIIIISDKTQTNICSFLYFCPPNTFLPDTGAGWFSQ